jgi:NADH-quinone oxidoreductase subunit N
MMPPLLPVLPLIIIATTIVVGIVAISIRRNQVFIFCLTLAGIFVAFVTLPVLDRIGPRAGGILFFADSFALFYGGLTLAGTFAVAVLSYDYLQRRIVFETGEEYYLLLLGALLGGLALISARHFVSFFLGLEVLSISLYALIGYYRQQHHQTEGAIKYLILSGVSSAFLLFGMAVIYGVAGTMDFGRLGATVTGAGHDALLISSAVVFLVVGIGFKLGVVPFHMWTPDVYQSAPAPVTGFIATVSKGSIFALLLRFLEQSGLLARPKVFVVFVIIAVASMFAGNLLALFQKDIKRLLAYSSISHFGYMLVGVLVAGPFGLKAATYYLTAYFVTTIGAFGVVALLSDVNGDAGPDAGSIDEYRGLFGRRPWLAGSFTLMLLSLAGMPLTAGFIGKIYVVAAGTATLLWLPVISLIVSSAIGLFYYLRVVIAMFDKPVTPVLPGFALPLKGCTVVAALCAILVWWGVYPSYLMRIIETIGIGQ